MIPKIKRPWLYAWNQWFKAGDLETFIKLNRAYFVLKDFVQPGEGMSRSIGFPTLNFYYDNDQWCGIKPGCYQTLTIIDNHRYQGLTCVIFLRSTSKKQWLVATYLRDFNKIHPKSVPITVVFLKFYRDNYLFTTWEKMKKIIQGDLIQFQKFSQVSEVLLQAGINMLKLNTTI